MTYYIGNLEKTTLSHLIILHSITPRKFPENGTKKYSLNYSVSYQRLRSVQDDRQRDTHFVDLIMK
jgi:hypothetical protein